MTSSGLKFPTRESLYEWLRPRVKEEDFASWGVKPGTKTTHNLWIELAEGESFLDDSTTPPCRTVSVASIQILNPTDSTKVLIESHQELSDGSVRHRGRPLAEKMKPGETVEAAALRAVKEELGPTLSVRIVPGSYRKKTNERVSGSYPGMPGSDVLHIVDAYVDGLPEEDFCTPEQGEQEELHRHASSQVHDAVTVKKHFWKWDLYSDADSSCGSNGNLYPLFWDSPSRYPHVKYHGNRRKIKAGSQYVRLEHENAMLKKQLKGQKSKNKAYLERIISLERMVRHLL